MCYTFIVLLEYITINCADILGRYMYMQEVLLIAASPNMANSIILKITIN